MYYDIKRNDVIVDTVVFTGNRVEKIMDVNILSVTFSLSYYREFTIGDTTVFEGEKYTIKTQPDWNEKSSIEWEYTLEFRGRAYDLINSAFLGLDGENNLTQGNFSLMGNADTIVDLLLQNANRLDSGWTKGTIDDTAAQNFTFANDNCLSVLSTLADTFKTEWWVENQTIYLTKKGVVQDLTFQYGQGNGFYDLKRTTQTTKNVCTRLYAYGSDQNIPSTYRGYSNNLKLPGNILYIEKNVDKYGIIEHIETFSDIKPEYIGTITDVSGPYLFTDTGIDFNLNNQKLPGVTPKVSFLTGQLAGYICEVGSYDTINKVVRILTNQNEKALVIPSTDFKPAIGDTYSFIGLDMPQSYIDDAEQRLLVAANTYIDENCEPIVVYSANCDPINFALRQVELKLGNYVRVIDTRAGLDKNIRVTAITRDLQNKYAYSIDLQEVISIPQAVREYNTYAGIKSAVSINKLTDVARARLNWRTTNELRSKIYDPDGNYFDMNNIKPGSIETLMLSVGAKAQQFILRDITFYPNYDGDPEKFDNTAGQLVHETIADSPVTWNIDSKLITGLDVTKAYYIYLKCNKADSTGTVLLSETIIKTEQLDGYYVFLAGVLHSVIDNVRGISLTYGQSTVNGRFITTGRIQSADGLTFFDLDKGLIGGAIQFGDKGTSSVVDGNLITSGTIILAEGSLQKAGITGAGTGDTSIRIWAGSTYDNREKAPFRVTQAGSVVMTNADVTGTIKATSGKIGNFNIDDIGLINLDGTDAYIKQIHTFGDGKTAEVKIGITALDLNSGTALASFIHDKVGDIQNVALYARASGAIQNNNAIICDGDFALTNGSMFLNNARDRETNESFSGRVKWYYSTRDQIRYLTLEPH